MKHEFTLAQKKHFDTLMLLLYIQVTIHKIREHSHAEDHFTKLLLANYESIVLQFIAFFQNAISNVEYFGHVLFLDYKPLRRWMTGHQCLMILTPECIKCTSVMESKTRETSQSYASFVSGLHYATRINGAFLIIFFLN